MAYKDMLSDIIKKSKLSLREISNRCKTEGISITPSYISQIQTGKLPPPSEEVSTAIAKVCKVDAVDLVFEGYMEKAPEIIKYYLTVVSETNKQLLETIAPYFDTINDEHLLRFIEDNNKITRLNFTISYLRKLQHANGVNPIIDLFNVIKSKFNDKYDYDELKKIYMEDNSMEPLIPKDSKIRYSKYIDSEINNSDVILFEYIGKRRFYVRRYYKKQNSIILVPENKEFDIIDLQNINEILVYGKVISYTANLQ